MGRKKPGEGWGEPSSGNITPIAQEGKMKLIELDPGDALVIRCKGEIPVEVAINIKSQLSKIIPKDVEILILTAGIDLDVIKKSINP
jgi:hypothetical protein